MKWRSVFGLCVNLAVVVMAVSNVTAQPPSNPSAPPLLPAVLPVFKLISPAVNNTTVAALARSFPGISNPSVYTDTTHARTVRFTSVNSDTKRLVQQFGASGGFFVYNFRRAFTETAASNLGQYGPAWLCSYLQTKQLFPSGIDPLVSDCGNPQLPYDPTPIYLSTFNKPTAQGAEGTGPAGTQVISTLTQIGLVYHVPLSINVSAATPSYIRLGGPGGHLSILLTGDGDQESLDPSYPGVNAIASPWHERTLEKQGDYPMVTAAQAIARYKGVAPGATITPGQPSLEYYIGDPAVPQSFTVPMWHFPDATANVDGQVVDLRGLWLPAVDGFLPSANIINPPSGTPYFPGRPVTITSTIGGSAGPFSYTLSLDDGSVVKSGVAPSGTLPIPISSLPLFTDKGQPVDLHLQLTVTDTNGSNAQDSVTLDAPQLLYMPILMRGGATTQFALNIEVRDVNAVQDGQPNSVAANHSMGVEFIQYYNGTNNDLSGVPPDANGFYFSLAAAGWSSSFYYPNNSAWERDWRDCSLGGADCSYGVDRTEFAYFSGHGSPARIYFGTNINHYSFFGGDARYQNVRWAAFSSCQTLRAGPYVGTGNPPLTYWFNAFQGAYMLLGFHSNMGDIAFGGPLIDNMRVPLLFGFAPAPWLQVPVREAWVETAFAMNAGKPAYLYAVGAFDPVNFRLPDPSRGFDYFATPLTGIYGYRWVWWD